MTEQETQLKFPLVWHGRLVTFAKAGDMAEIIMDVLLRMDLEAAQVMPGNTSSNGTYRTWQISAKVLDQDMLHALFFNLEHLPNVKMLI